MIDSLGHIPNSVYRLQMSENFNLKSATSLISYLYDLGVEGVYLSPLFAYSDNVYAITDPNEVDSRIGTKNDFENFCSALQKHNMKLILDIVPNHMSLKDNPWFLDLLKKGRSSKYFSFFDVHWDECNGKVLLPILGSTYEKALEKGEIRLIEKGHEAFIECNDFFLPLCKASLEQPLKGISLHELLEKQHYQLTHWNLAIDKINYRRFFNINGLIAINMENEEVFQEYHKWILSLVAAKKVQGLRIDHIDGLYNPLEYLKRLRGQVPFIWVEKILIPHEKLPHKWPVDGTVGYEFLHLLSNLFIFKENEKKITQIYQEFIEDRTEFSEIAYQRKKVFVEKQMYSAIDYLGNLFEKLTFKDPASQEFTKRHFIMACVEVVSCFPVYRTYVDSPKITKEDKIRIHQAIIRAKQKAPFLSSQIFDAIQSLLLFEKEGKVAEEFIFRFQQMTATSMAKGLEDSAFYIYSRLISLNEVGGDPAEFGTYVKEFHEFNHYKLTNYPLGALSSSTHDTKFSEDARLRVHALTELPSEWEKFLLEAKKETSSIDLNTLYYLFQIVLALGPTTNERVWFCLQKAIREMGVHTSWEFPREEYESKVKAYLYSFLDSKKIAALQSKVDRHLVLKSLSALILKIGSCGVFELYQGNEQFLYQLTDPDNRKYIPKPIESGDEKYRMTKIGLNFRKEHKDLFLKGEYIPLEASDPLVAFIRSYKSEIALVVAERFFFESSKTASIKFPSDLPKLVNIFTGRDFCIKNPFGIFYGNKI
jgi:(1->4)-alpha-D-glucan 1-alpha-D-glucosylmutase